MARGKLDKALAIYRRGDTACMVAIATDDTDLRAREDFALAIGRDVFEQ
jgi:hypothetical protein